MADFSRRSHAPELMDGEGVTLEQFAACMADLAKVNTVTMARRPTLAFIRQAILTTSPDSRPVILDVGFGAGDMLRGVATMLRKMRRQAKLIGIDLNWRSEEVARRVTPDWMAIDWRTGDAYALEMAEWPDLIISSLVSHHMDDAEIVRFLVWMEATARQGWLINDLHRHPLAWHGFRAMAALARWHPFVRHDGPLSIERSFRQDDWQKLIAKAGVGDHAAIRWRFPFRYCVERRRW